MSNLQIGDRVKMTSSFFPCSGHKGTIVYVDEKYAYMNCDCGLKRGGFYHKDYEVIQATRPAASMLELFI
jgi:hypothetical protein